MNRSCWVIAAVIACFCAGVSSGTESLSVLLEKGIYTEETAGDLDGAMKIYRQVMDQAVSNQQWGAEASYRLGHCYLKKGDTTNALEAFRFTAAHASDTNLAAAASTKIGDINWHPLALEKKPWANGEVTLYFSWDRNGRLLGVVENLSKAERYEGRDVWLFDQRSLPAGLTEYRQYTRVIADATNLTPILSFYDQGPFGMSKMFYEPDGVMVISEIKGVSSTRKVPLDEAFYDLGELDRLIRSMPLVIGYKQRIPGFYVQEGKTYTEFEVMTAREQITVPAGTFQCFVLKGFVSTRGQVAIWVSDDDHRYVVKVFYPFATMELARVMADPERNFMTNGTPDFEPLIKEFKEQQAKEISTQSPNLKEPQRSLAADLANARVDMETRKARVEQVEMLTADELANASGFIVADETIARLRLSLNETELALKEAVATKDKADPQVKTLTVRLNYLKSQMSEALEGLKKELQADYEVARKKYEALLKKLQPEVQPKN